MSARTQPTPTPARPSTTADPYLLAAPLPVLTHAVEAPAALLHRATVVHHVDTVRDVPTGVACMAHSYAPPPLSHAAEADHQHHRAGRAGRAVLAFLTLALTAALAAVLIISHGTWMPR